MGATACAPAGVAAFHFGDPKGIRRQRVPTGKKAPRRIDPVKGDALRAAQDNMCLCALLVGDERGAMGRAMTGWLKYHASVAPSPSPRQDGISRWGERTAVNLPGGDLRLPPVLYGLATIPPSAGPLPITVSLRKTALEMP